MISRTPPIAAAPPAAARPRAPSRASTGRADMRVTVVQMNAGHDRSENIAQAGRLIDAAVSADTPDIVGLPEMWTCLGGDRAGRFAQAEALPPAGSGDAGGPAYEFLRRVAREKRIYVHGGSIGELAPGGERLFNTTIAFDREGRELARYRKIHLFDITRPDGTGLRESNTYGGGSEIVTYDAGALRVGCAICYDLRFPELFLALRRAGAELIFLPSAFTVPTGRDHWEVLLRARAIETQCWLAAPATWGQHSERGATRETYGHSLICDPWGAVAARVANGVGWASTQIDPAQTARVRQDMPVFAHRKLV